MLQAQRITELQDQATARWHEDGSLEPAGCSSFEALVLRQHRANFDLWHEEDDARDPHVEDRIIAKTKRAIDALNQQRNDLVEELDLALLKLAADQRAEAPLHSETPGLIVDRLSILALKIFHTAEEVARLDASEQHRARNGARLAVLQEQRDDLQRCLQDLWSEVLAGRRRFKLYRQMKMYNDPTLNPVLRKAHTIA